MKMIGSGLASSAMDGARVANTKLPQIERMIVLGRFFCMCVVFVSGFCMRHF